MWLRLLGAEEASDHLDRVEDRLTHRAGVAITVGHGAEAAIQGLSVDIISSTRTRGLYAGFSPNSGVVATRGALNQTCYGKEVGPTDILIRWTAKKPAGGTSDRCGGQGRSQEVSVRARGIGFLKIKRDLEAALGSDERPLFLLVSLFLNARNSFSHVAIAR